MNGDARIDFERPQVIARSPRDDLNAEAEAREPER